ncbi:MAG: hypothetical protein ABIS21_07325 [Acidimicrobiales bacterium]
MAILAAPLLIVQTTAWAVWTDASVASANYTTATLAPPTGPATVAGLCVALVSDQIKVSWTATASTWAYGYEVARSTTSGGPYTLVGTVVGQAITEYLDTSLPFSTTYHYVVRAIKNNWRSAYTAQVSRTTRSITCL